MVEQDAAVLLSAEELWETIYSEAQAVEGVRLLGMKSQLHHFSSEPQANYVPILSRNFFISTCR